MVVVVVVVGGGRGERGGKVRSMRCQLALMLYDTTVFNAGRSGAKWGSANNPPGVGAVD
jgi:hypothetical protein